MSDNCFICETPPGSGWCDRCYRAFRSWVSKAKGARSDNQRMQWAARRARRFEVERAGIERGHIQRRLDESRMSASAEYARRRMGF